MTRPTWDEVWLQAAAVVAERSLCSRAHVGAVITDSRNRIISTGYNNPPAGFNHGSMPCINWCPRANKTDDFHPEYDDCYALHAEANALIAADRSTWQGGTIYVLGDCCFNCAKLIANSGLARVVVKVDQTSDHRQPAKTYRFLRGLNIEVEVV
jgi:dCMP deaminase